MSKFILLGTYSVLFHSIFLNIVFTLSGITITNYFLPFLKRCIYLFIYLRQSTYEQGQEQREKERESQADSSWSVEHDVGLDVMTHEIMSWARIKSLMSNWQSHPGTPACSLVTTILVLDHFLNWFSEAYCLVDFSERAHGHNIPWILVDSQQLAYRLYIKRPPKDSPLNTTKFLCPHAIFGRVGREVMLPIPWILSDLHFLCSSILGPASAS